jgi:serine/threonine protein kinase
MTDGGEVFRPGGSLGPYEIERRIGEGGMCVVWKGKHRSLGKAVAIKVLSPDHARKESARGRFVQEGQALARIHHDNVIEVHDVGVVGESPYLIMAFLDGADLATLFAARGALSPGELADVMIPVCAGVAAAHDEQIIHRDIKPENIFLARTPRRGGRPEGARLRHLARGRRPPSGRTPAPAALMGTPKYMSPEQTRGAKYPRRTHRPVLPRGGALSGGDGAAAGRGEGAAPAAATHRTWGSSRRRGRSGGICRRSSRR